MSPCLPGLPFMATLAAGPHPPAGQPAWLGWQAWVLALALSLGDYGHGVYDPEIDFPKHGVVFPNTLKSTLLHSRVHMKTEWE